MEQNSPSAGDFSLNVFSLSPYANSQPDARVSEGDKAGATLLFSGAFLGLVGLTFTVKAWIQSDQGLGWTQLLGPILLSVGVTFALIAVCKFKMLTCKSCKRSNETAIDPEQPTTGQSFVFSGINQPITFHGATVVQCIPPPYTYQDAIARSSTASSLAPNNSSPGMISGIVPPIFPPQYCSIYPLENPAFVEDEESSQSPDYERSPASGQHHEYLPSVQRHSGSPPLYEELFPSRK